MPSKDEAPKKVKAVETPKSKAKLVTETKPAEIKAKKTVSKPVKLEKREIPAQTDAPVEPEVVVTEAPVENNTAAAETSVPVETVASSGLKGGKLRRVNITNMRGTIIKVAAIAVGLIAVVLLVFGILIYVYKSENPAVKTVASIVPYPVERVNGNIFGPYITYKEYMFQVDSEKLAQQSNAKINNQPAIDFNSADGKKLVTQIKQHSLTNLERAVVVQQLADQKGVKVTDKQLNDALDQLTKSNGGKDAVLKTIQSYYGWNWNDLKNVLRKQLLEKNLSEKLAKDPAADKTAKTKAENLVKDLRGGKDFTEVAKANSQASDASAGGDLGFFTKGQIPDELQKAAEALKAGEVSDPVKDAYGYEIIKVVEKKDDGSIHGQHILIETVDFTSYLQEKISKAKINKYVKA